MKIYIASSWKHQHAVEMLTWLLRDAGHEVHSFAENEPENNPNWSGREMKGDMQVPFDAWVWTTEGERCFKFDTEGATKSDLVVYIGPSGCDAWSEVGAAWSLGIPIIGLWAKGEQVGLMRRMVHWRVNYRQVLETVESYAHE